MPLPEGDTPAAWRQADRRRRDFLAERRKLMHLELAALQARSCGTVEVLDTRWWRLLRPSVMTGDSDETWSGERALAAAGGENCRIFDLPLPDRDTQARVSALRDRIARRLAESTRTSTREEAVASGPDLPPPGVHLFLGRGTDPWPALVRWLTLGWEAGDLGRWLLLVTDEPPTGAAEVVAAAGVDGATAWPPEQDDRPWGPVVWARPRDLSDTRLIQRLEKVPPQAILAGDLAAWLPTEGHDGQLEAVALRRILHGRAERVFLRAESLAETWTYFFSDVCQARINLHGPLETTAPARTTAPPVADEAATAPAAGTVDRPRPEAACGFALAPLSEHLGFNPGWGEVRQAQLFTATAPGPRRADPPSAG